MKNIIFKPSTLGINNIIPPPSPSKKNMPEWFLKTAPYFLNNKKPIKSDGSGNLTVKKCIPFLDSMQSGYTIVTPCDILINTDSSYKNKIMWNIDFQIIVALDNNQSGGLKSPNGYDEQIYRWENLWHITTPKGYSCMFSHPQNRFDLPFLTMSGIVDTDLHINPISVPFFIKNDFDGIIPKGTPIISIFPFKRESWKSHIEEYDEKNTFEGSMIIKSYLQNAYKKLYWSKKEYL